MGMKYIGVDVGGTSVKAGLSGIMGELLDKWKVRARRGEGGRRILLDVTRSIRDKMEEVGLGFKTDLVGIGLRILRPVMPDGFVKVCANLGWCRMDPQEELSSLLGGIIVKSGNDTNMAALRKMRQDGGKGYKDLAMITLGAGVGGDVTIDGKIIAGRHDPGDGTDHIHVKDGGWEHCNHGGVGYMEQICSATGIAREARRKMEASDKPLVLQEHGGNVTAKDVLDTAKIGDELANEVMDVVGRCLGLALSMAVMIVGPEIFVINGGVSRAGQSLIDVVQKHYNYFTPVSKYKERLGLTALGNDTGIYGAARLALQD